MNFTRLAIPDVVLVTPKLFGDARGWFMETWHAGRFADAALDLAFVQDNHSYSRAGTLRGLHYQILHPQGKLVRALRGEIFDVAVDLRRSSATFGHWVGEVLSAENKAQLYVPPGFAHGFVVTSDEAEMAYKCTDFYHPEHERTILWDDPDLGIAWPLPAAVAPLLSDKDRAGTPFHEAEVYV